jgi:hypothetical protein
VSYFNGDTYNRDLYANIIKFDLDNMPSDPIVFIYSKPNASYTGLNAQPPTVAYVVEHLKEVSTNRWELCLSSLATMVEQTSNSINYLQYELLHNDVEIYVFRKITNADNTGQSPLRMYDRNANLTSDLSMKPLITKRMYESPWVSTSKLSDSLVGSNGVAAQFVGPPGVDLDNNDTWGTWSSVVASNIGDSSLTSGGSTGIKKPALMAVPSSGCYSYYNFFTVATTTALPYFPAYNVFASNTIGGQTSWTGSYTSSRGGVQTVTNSVPIAGSLAYNDTTGLMLTYTTAKVGHIVRTDGISSVWIASRVKTMVPVNPSGTTNPKIFTFVNAYVSEFDFLYTNTNNATHCYPRDSSGNLTMVDTDQASGSVPVIDGADYD